MGREDQLADRLMTAAGYCTAAEEMALPAGASKPGVAAKLSATDAGNLVFLMRQLC